VALNRYEGETICLNTSRRHFWSLCLFVCVWFVCWLKTLVFLPCGACGALQATEYMAMKSSGRNERKCPCDKQACDEEPGVCTKLCQVPSSYLKKENLFRPKATIARGR
jgi:hypothetical protein